MLAALTKFAQDYSNYYTTYSTPTSTSSGMSSGLLMFLLLIVLVVVVVMVVATWKIFVKAGKPGWAAIVPIYNTLVLLEVVGRPWWWILFFLLGFIPFVGGIVTLVISIIIYNDLSKSFGQGAGMTVLLVLVPFVGFPMLGFGNYQYHGPAALNGAGGAGHHPAAGGTHPTAPAA